MTNAIRKAMAAAALFCASALASLSSQAAIFVVGEAKGAPGEVVQLTVTAEDITFGGLDILVNLRDAPVSIESITPTADYSTGGIGLCDVTVGSCGFFYLSPKAIAASTALATFQFRVDDDALVGLYDFDLEVLPDTDQIFLPPGRKFEVLAVIPEPTTWMLMSLGLLGLAAGIGRRATH